MSEVLRKTEHKILKPYLQADELAVDKVTKNRKYRKKIETNNS